MKQEIASTLNVNALLSNMSVNSTGFRFGQRVFTQPPAIAAGGECSVNSRFVPVSGHMRAMGIRMLDDRLQRHNRFLGDAVAELHLE